MAKKKQIKKKQPKKKPVKISVDLNQLISTKCTNCNLRLVVPEVESHRCLLCGSKELNRQTYTNA